MEMPCIPALDPLVSALSRYLGAPLSTRVGAQYSLDADYFNRMDALNYAIGHDDGQGGQDLERADVILVGVSRTSKTPTSIYLAHRGVRAANVPLVTPDGKVPPKLLAIKGVPIVALTLSPDRLLEIRRNRLKSLNERRECDLRRRRRGAPGGHRGAAALRAPGLAGDRRHPPLRRGDRCGGDQHPLRRPRPGRGAGVNRGVTIVLASKSRSRAAVLSGAGVAFEAEDSGVDEAALKSAAAGRRRQPPRRRRTARRGEGAGGVSPAAGAIW